MLSRTYEQKLTRLGLRLIAGVDEAGRGPLAGPILAAAVILPSRTRLPGLNDSKKLSHLQREKLYLLIRAQAISIGIGLVDQQTIDQINIGQANYLALRLAVEQLAIAPDGVLVDGKRRIPELACYQLPIVGGDGKSPSIAAASIIAKVTRDRIMDEWHQKYPQYGFDHHRGYGTREHYKNISRYGLCPIHRRSFIQIA